MQLRRTHTLWHILLLLGLLLSLLIQPKEINAQNNETEPNFMVVEYAKLHNLSYEEAERRLQLQIEMSALEGQIIDGEPTYAGSWTQHEPEFRLIVAFTTPNGQEIIQKYLEGITWADLVEVRQAKYTVAELTAILEQVNQAAQTTTVPFESGDNIPAGKVTLYTREPEELRRQLETQVAVKPYIDDLEFVYQERLSVPLVANDEQDPGVASYAKLIGISTEEAERRLKLQGEMDGLERKVLEGEPTYAGSWTIHEPEFGLVIAFAAADGEEKLSPYLEGIDWANLVKVQQLPYTDDELLQILEKVNAAAKETGIPFESGANPRTAKVDIYTPEPDKLRSTLEAQNKIPDYMDDISLIFQESLSIPLELKYPYLPGGVPINSNVVGGVYYICTTGLAVKRNSDGRRFMMTAGHCENEENIVYNGASSVYLGPIVHEIYSSVGDIQMHDVSVRSLDLTNGIFINPGTTYAVTATETKATTMNDYVCKYGRTTAYTCGNVTSTSFFGGNFVKVQRPAGVTGNITCGGDSGAPVFKPFAGNVVTALGILNGGGPGPDCTTGYFDYFYYTPVDTVNNAGFTVLTSPYQQRYHQNVFWTETNCIEYRQAYDDNGNTSGSQTSSPCSTSAPGSGTIETYTAWVVGNYWRESLWRGGIGYTRNVPLNGNGTINWGAGAIWSQCCSGTAPRSQDGYILGNYIYQNVFWTETNCLEYKRALDNNGNPTGTQTSQTCRTSAPGSGTITSYTIYIVGERARESIWRGGVGYIRDISVNADNADLNWTSAPAWQVCCSGPPTRAQGGDVLSYP